MVAIFLFSLYEHRVQCDFARKNHLTTDCPSAFVAEVPGGAGRQRLLQPDWSALSPNIWNDGKGGMCVELPHVTLDGLVQLPDVFARFLCVLQLLHGVKASALELHFQVYLFDLVELLAAHDEHPLNFLKRHATFDHGVILNF